MSPSRRVRKVLLHSAKLFGSSHLLLKISLKGVGGQEKVSRNLDTVQGKCPFSHVHKSERQPMNFPDPLIRRYVKDRMVSASIAGVGSTPFMTCSTSSKTAPSMNPGALGKMTNAYIARVTCECTLSSLAP